MTTSSIGDPPLRATLRMQFHRGFTLYDAVPLVSYFARLGISHLYVSPLFTARPGSPHGYDIIDPTCINPELGGETGLETLAKALQQHRMGLILDIVPNHCAVGGSANKWWRDVLQWGRNSTYASFFDIDWQPPEPSLHNRVLAPFLRCDYDKVLADGEIALYFDPVTGALQATHHKQRFPLCPHSYATVLQQAENPSLGQLAHRFATLSCDAAGREKMEKLCLQLATLTRASTVSRSALQQALTQFSALSPEGTQRLHQLLEQQYYRLAGWRTAASQVNWRRFFDINELAGLRAEDPQVFDACHSKLFELIERRLIQGVRIDHVDGLADPRAYCRKLRRRIDSIRPGTREAPFPIYVEKILIGDEQLADDWQVEGTTGYDFMEEVSLLLHDPAGEADLRKTWTAISGRSDDFAREVYTARHHVLEHSLAADVNRLANDLVRLARQQPATREFDYCSILRTLVELIAHFPVYRTYANSSGRSEQDERVFARALVGARRSLPESHGAVLDQLALWLGGQPLCQLPPGPQRKQRQRALTRFQQLTSPAAAKAVEDTAGYRAGVLLSRYEVGANSDCFSTPVSDFHHRCSIRQRTFPATLLTTATHDSKRGEDTRARLAILSERAPWFIAQLNHWRELAAPLRSSANGNPVPSAGDEHILYQTLLGTWPLGLTGQPQDGKALAAYLERLQTWQRKALREAKLATSWQSVEESYEQGCHNFLHNLLTAASGQELRVALAEAAAAIAPAGALNSLTQCLLRMTAPGIPDLYQGTEWWDFSLVDPDNRRPVDFAARRLALERPDNPCEFIAGWQDGRIKQYLISLTLETRALCRALSPDGAYLPVQVQGAQAHQVIAFARLYRDDCALVVAPLRCASLLGNSPLPHIPSNHWGDTHLVLPEALNNRRYSSRFSATSLAPSDGTLPLAALLADFPVNLLLAHANGGSLR